MAVAVTFDDVKKAVVSILQSSQTAYGAGTTGNAPDGSNAMFPSADEINDAILYADAEVCTLICNTLQHPFQTTFIQASSVLGNVAPLPIRNGMPLRVYGVNGVPKAVISVDGPGNYLEVANHGLVTGDLINFYGTVIGGGLAANTNYYVVESALDPHIRFEVAATYIDAVSGSIINLTNDQPTDSFMIEFTESLKARNADEVKEVIQSPDVFGTPATPWFFMEGDYLLSTSLTNRVIYTDYTKTSDPQAPQPFRNALVAGAVARLAKDGNDQEMVGYYNQLYTQYLGMIASGNTVLPEFTAYAVAGKG